MNRISLDVRAAGLRRVLGWAAVIGSVAAACVIGLLAAESSSSTATAPKVHARAGQSEAVQGPATLMLLPSLSIEANPQFFFGTGDGSNGYDAVLPPQ
jgi:hypothetical protein